MEKLKKNNQGITLIALVITIIVLLILAGVSIAMLTGNNGILKKADDAKRETSIKGAKEAVELEVAGSFDDNGKYSATIAKANMEKNLNGATVTESNGTLSVNYEGSNFKVDKNGKVTDGLTAAIIASASQNELKDIYGAKVTNYSCVNNSSIDNWKIFYSDGNNIFLIADNYLERNYLPFSTKNGVPTSNKPNDRGDSDTNSRSINFQNVIGDYETGSGNITDTKIQNLNIKYFEYLKSNNIETSSRDNMKAVAYMLDKTAWNGFKDNTDDSKAKAEYAIGGPTVEMLFNSYNSKYGTNYKYKVENISGYKISVDNGENWNTYANNAFKKEDELYVVPNTYANAMWLASPSQHSFLSGQVMGVYSSGTIDSNNCSNDNSFGLRPVVCLKDTVSLYDNGNGTYTIQ